MFDRFKLVSENFGCFLISLALLVSSGTYAQTVEDFERLAFPPTTIEKSPVLRKWMKPANVGFFTQLGANNQRFAQHLFSQISRATNNYIKLDSRRPANIIFLISKNLEEEIEKNFKDVILRTRAGDKFLGYGQLITNIQNNPTGCTIDVVTGYGAEDGKPKGLEGAFIFMDSSNSELTVQGCMIDGALASIGLYVSYREAFDRTRKNIINNKIENLIRILYNENFNSGQTKKEAVKMFDTIVNDLNK